MQFALYLHRGLCYVARSCLLLTYGFYIRIPNTYPFCYINRRHLSELTELMAMLSLKEGFYIISPSLASIYEAVDPLYWI